ncbi:insecticidal delta-endotoxin Cry8Ea1 family protein [Bacillus thuringiensis]|uniref:insecticidal delta-endotoxin Cry8Ea1 family protein n=1 Tax=Bacillus thuringiensis TaxID=1428 RepID=UPI00333AE113
MNQTDVMNATIVAEVEGIKKVQEKYPDMKISDLQYSGIVPSNAELQASLKSLNGQIYPDILKANKIEKQYPLNRVPNSELQNMSFPEWQDLCGNVNPQRRIDIDLETGITAAAGIAWAVLGISNPIGSAVAGIANVLIPILWPTEAADPNAIWLSMANNVENLIDQKIDANTKRDGIAALNGLKALINDFTNALNLLKQNPTNEGLKENVRTKYSILDAQFIFNINGLFSKPGSQTLLLTTYVEAANLHLLFIRDAVKFGHEWGMDPLLIEREYTNLTNVIITYTNHCIRWFDEGLRVLNPATNPLHKPANMWDCTKYPWVAYEQYQWYLNDPPRNCASTNLTSTCDEPTKEPYRKAAPRLFSYRDPKGEYRGLENWNLYNNFRRDMTILVLDVVSVWPTYDPREYPLGTKSELTRTLYTSIRGTTYRGDSTQNTISAIDNRMIQQPRLFTWLNRLSFQSIWKPASSSGDYFTRGTILTGGSQYQKYTLGDSFEERFGQNGTQPIQSVDITPESSITNLVTRQWFEPREIAIYKGNTHIFTLGTIEETTPGFTGIVSSGCRPNGGLPKKCIYDPTRTDNKIPKSVNPNTPNAPASAWIDSHRLSYFKYEPMRNDAGFGYASEGQIGAVTFGWTHMLVDPNNTISSDQITRISAVKGLSTIGDTSVIKGPGCTGGNVVSLKSPTNPDGSFEFAELSIRVTGVRAKAYQVRIRYAASQSIARFGFSTSISDGGPIFSTLESLSSTYSGSLTCNSFGYHTLSRPLPATDSTSWRLTITNSSGGNSTVIIDKIEFIPIQGSLEDYEANQKLETARKVVNALFSDNTKQRLKDKILGSDLNIAMDMIENIPDGRFQKEKMILRDRIKQAKRLSQSRNLLQYGDFESSDWSGENGWKISKDVSVESTNPVLKGKYLNLPSARDPLSDGTVYPTYAYQKVDESKLKPYTRYWIRGLIGSSQDLELIVLRYHKEVHKTLNVPDNLDLTSLRSHLESLSGPEMLGQVRENLQDMYCGPYSPLVQSTGDTGENSHLFSCPIDIGDLDLENNPGIEVAFKINSIDGGAQIRHIELVEGAPLTSEEIARVKRQEKKWKQKREQRCAQDQDAIRAAQIAVNKLFVSPTCVRLKLETTLQDIVYAQTLVNAIPDRYNPIISELPGMNMDIFNQLQNQLELAQGLYNTRNVVVDGDFMSGLANWNATEGAEIQQIDGTSVVVISDWGANVSQELCVNPEHAYLLRVTARKEGSGKGYVTISDCTEDNTETVTFLSDEEMSTESLRDMSIETASTGETPYVGGSHTMNVPSNRYTGNSYSGDHNMNNQYVENSYPSHTNMNYQSESFGINPYGDQNQMMNYPNNDEMNAYPNNTNMTNAHGAGCGCGCSTNAYSDDQNQMINYPSNNDEMNVYPSENNMNHYSAEAYGTESYPSPMTVQNGSLLSGYVTKTVEIFPETNRVRIEMGETAGTFMVESIELIQMDCE